MHNGIAARLGEKLIANRQTPEQVRQAVLSARQETANEVKRKSLRRLAWQLEMALRHRDANKAIGDAAKVIARLTEELNAKAQ